MLSLLATLACAPRHAPPVEARMLYGAVERVRLGEASLADLGACAARAARRGAAVGGEVEVVLSVLHGEVLGAEVEELPVEDPRLAACVEARAARWRMPASVDGEVHAGATIGGAAPAATAAPTDEAAVQQVQAHYAKLRACYEQRLAADPTLRGRLGLRLQVERGAVTGVTFTGEELTDPALLRCVEQAAAGWAFESERTGVVATTILLTP